MRRRRRLLNVWNPWSNTVTVLPLLRRICFLEDLVNSWGASTRFFRYACGWSYKRHEMLEPARQDAERLVSEDPNLERPSSSFLRRYLLKEFGDASFLLGVAWEDGRRGSRRLHLNEMQLPLPPALFEVWIWIVLDSILLKSLKNNCAYRLPTTQVWIPLSFLFILALMVSSSSCTRCFGTELFSYMILLTTSMSMKH